MKPSDPDKACKKCGLPKMYCICKSILAALGQGLIVSITIIGVVLLFPSRPSPLKYPLLNLTITPHQPYRPPVLFYAMDWEVHRGGAVTHPIVRVGQRP